MQLWEVRHDIGFIVFFGGGGGGGRTYSEAVKKNVGFRNVFWEKQVYPSYALK